MKLLKDARGFSLTEVVVAVAISAVVMLAMGSIAKYQSDQSTQMRMKNTILELRQKALLAIQNDSTWIYTRNNNSVSGQDIFACTKETAPGSGVWNSCEAADSVAQPIALFDSPRGGNVVPLAYRVTEIAGDANETRGFSSKGDPCNTFPSYECPIQMLAKWKPMCIDFTGGCDGRRVQDMAMISFKIDVGTNAPESAKLMQKTMLDVPLVITRPGVKPQDMAENGECTPPARITTATTPASCRLMESIISVNIGTTDCMDAGSTISYTIKYAGPSLKFCENKKPLSGPQVLCDLITDYADISGGGGPYSWAYNATTDEWTGNIHTADVYATGDFVGAWINPIGGNTAGAYRLRNNAGDPNFCSPLPGPVNGVCGPANGTTVGATPSVGLCSVGATNPLIPTLAGSTYSWSCMGATGGSNAACTATKSAAPINGVCGTDNGTTVAATPTNVCTAGTVTPAVPTLAGSTYSWACNGSGGGSNAACTATKAAAPINGVCGTAQGTSISTPPVAASAKCSAGNSSIVTTAGASYNWTCAGIAGGTNAACSAIKVAAPVNGVCGTANGQNVASAPSGGARCSTGTSNPAVPALAGITYSWSCDGSGGGSNAACTATQSAAPVNGACGTDNGKTFLVASPPTVLCALGAQSAVAPTASSFTWTCTGTGGGTTANCTAKKAPTCNIVMAGPFSGMGPINVSWTTTNTTSATFGCQYGQHGPLALPNGSEAYVFPGSAIDGVHRCFMSVTNGGPLPNDTQPCQTSATYTRITSPAATCQITSVPSGYGNGFWDYTTTNASNMNWKFVDNSVTYPDGPYNIPSQKPANSSIQFTAGYFNAKLTIYVNGPGGSGNCSRTASSLAARCINPAPACGSLIVTGSNPDCGQCASAGGICIFEDSPGSGDFSADLTAHGC